MQPRDLRVTPHPGTTRFPSALSTFCFPLAACQRRGGAQVGAGGVKYRTRSHGTNASRACRPAGPAAQTAATCLRTSHGPLFLLTTIFAHFSMQANSRGQQRLGQSGEGSINDVNDEGSSEDQNDHDDDDDDDDANEGGSGGVVRFEDSSDTQRTRRVGGSRKPQSRKAVAPSGGKSSSAQLAACRSEVAK